MTTNEVRLYPCNTAQPSTVTERVYTYMCVYLQIYILFSLATQHIVFHREISVTARYHLLNLIYTQPNRMVFIFVNVRF